MFAQKIHEPHVFLNGEDFAGVLQQQCRERAEAGSDFQNLVHRGKVRRGDDALELVGIVQKILAEGFRELNPVRRQQFPHFGKFH